MALSSVRTTRIVNEQFIKNLVGQINIYYCDELLDLLEELHYSWANMMPPSSNKNIVLVRNHPDKYCLKLDGFSKTICYDAVEFLSKKGLEICMYSNFYGFMETVEGYSLCPICGSYGVDLSFAFECSNAKCQNYKTAFRP